MCLTLSFECADRFGVRVKANLVKGAEKLS